MDSIGAIVKLVASVVILAAALIRILPKAQDSDNTLRPPVIRAPPSCHAQYAAQCGARPEAAPSARCRLLYWRCGAARTPGPRGGEPRRRRTFPTKHSEALSKSTRKPAKSRGDAPDETR